MDNRDEAAAVPAVREPEGLFVDQRLTLRPAREMKAAAADAASFCALVRRHGGDKTVVYAGGPQISAVLDDAALRGRVDLKYAFSSAWREWSALAKGATVKDLKLHLARRGAECRTDAFPAALATLKFNVEIAVVEEVSDTRNLTLSFAQKEGAGSSRIPREVEIEIQVFEGSPHAHRIVLDVDYEIPKEEARRALFTLAMRDPVAVVEAAMAAEIEDVRAGLPEGALLVRGSPTSW